MQKVLRFWYIQSPHWVFTHLLTTLQVFEGQLAVRDTWRNITKPIFQDYTRQGRIIGFFLRVFRILFGFFVYAVLVLAYVGAYVVWLAFPLICIVWILGAFLGARG